MKIDSENLLIICYLLGSIPFGLILVRLSGKGDIRKIGSGNIGATNVLRAGNKFLALLTVLLDGGKGALAIYLGHVFMIVTADPDDDMAFTMLAALGVFLGHVFPVWLKFKGGKGVATALGIYLALSLPVGLTACAVWLLTAVIFRYSSLAGLMAMLVAPFIAWAFAAPAIVTPQTVTLITILIGLIVWQRHAGNIRRLLNHTEPKIGQKKETADATPAA